MFCLIRTIAELALSLSVSSEQCLQNERSEVNRVNRCFWRFNRPKKLSDTGRHPTIKNSTSSSSLRVKSKSIFRYRDPRWLLLRVLFNAWHFSVRRWDESWDNSQRQLELRAGLLMPFQMLPDFNSYNLVRSRWVPDCEWNDEIHSDVSGCNNFDSKNEWKAANDFKRDDNGWSAARRTREAGIL